MLTDEGGDEAKVARGLVPVGVVGEGPDDAAELGEGEEAEGDKDDGVDQQRVDVHVQLEDEEGHALPRVRAAPVKARGDLRRTSARQHKEG